MKKVLIVDDDPAILDALKIMLELEGYEIETALSGEPLYNMKDNYPDLILLDIWLSGQDGRSICIYLKNNPATKHIPVIMISASRDVDKSAKSAGADDYICKPFEMNDLLEKVGKLTETTVPI